MKKIQLHEVHESLGAKMVPFAEFKMPLQYSSITDEHKAVRKSVGLFDVSHMGEFIIRGKEATDLVQYVTSNNVKKLKIGQAQYSCLPRHNGGIVDDLIVYRLPEDNCSEGENAYMLVVNASNIKKDWDWIESKNRFNTKMIDISDKTSLLALQGPKAEETLLKLTDIDLSSIKFYHFMKGEVAGQNNIIISATGYTGSGGYELYMNNNQAVKVWNELMKAGEEFDIKPCGLGARDTLRLEMGYCLYGNDINDETNTIEAGLSWITKFTDDEFIGKSYLAKVKDSKPRRRLIGFEMEGRRVPRKGYSICDSADREIGKVTSGTMSPCLEKPIGMGYVKDGLHRKGTTIKIKLGKKYKNATIVKTPFYKGECK